MPQELLKCQHCQLAVPSVTTSKGPIMYQASKIYPNLADEIIERGSPVVRFCPLGGIAFSRDACRNDPPPVTTG